MSPDAQRKQMETEALRRREREYPIPRDQILADLNSHLGAMSEEQISVAQELIQSNIIDLVPIPELAQIVLNGGKVAHA